MEGAQDEALQARARRRGPTEPVPEVGYLVAPDARHYRPLMRLFYDHHLLQRFFIGVAEAHEHVLSLDPAYTAEQCQADLDQLAQWGNLTRHYERARVRTIEEFRRRQAVYQCTPEGIAVERFVRALEDEGRRAGALDRSALTALRQRMTELDALLAEPATIEALPDLAGGAGLAATGRRLAVAEPVATLWREVRDHFERVAQDGVGYLGALRNVQAQQIIEHGAFLAYKDVLVRYLSSYAVALAELHPAIGALAAEWVAGSRGRLLAYCAGAVAATQPLPDGTLPDLGREMARVTEQIEALAAWFRPAGDVTRLLRTTNDAIELVTRQAARLAELRFGTRSRRAELDELALVFLACTDPAQAERVASVAFAAALPRHFQGELASIPEGAGEASAWAEPPRVVELTPVRRGQRLPAGDEAPPERGPGRDDLIRQRLAAAGLAARRLDALFADGVLDLGDLAVDSPELRDEILDLVVRCLAAPDLRAEAADGSAVVVVLDPGQAHLGSLRAPDGEVRPPRLRLQRHRPDAASVAAGADGGP